MICYAQSVFNDSNCKIVSQSVRSLDTASSKLLKLLYKEKKNNNKNRKGTMFHYTRFLFGVSLITKYYGS